METPMFQDQQLPRFSWREHLRQQQRQQRQPSLSAPIVLDDDDDDDYDDDDETTSDSGDVSPFSFSPPGNAREPYSGIAPAPTQRQRKEAQRAQRRRAMLEQRADEDLARAIDASMRGDDDALVVISDDEDEGRDVQEVDRLSWQSALETPEQRRALREEQQRAYQRALEADRAKEIAAALGSVVVPPSALPEPEQQPASAPPRPQPPELPAEPAEGTTLAFRMPDGTRVVRRFAEGAVLGDIKRFVWATTGAPPGEFELTSEFPRRSYHDSPDSTTLEQAGIAPHSLLTVFIASR
eukprot:m51a1_g4879 hypothetical protein (296) ;mRNA; f:13360-23472